jgi:hypothetical protein
MRSLWRRRPAWSCFGLRAKLATLLLGMTACIDVPTTPIAADEAFLVVIARTDGPAEISAGERWTLRARRITMGQPLDTMVFVSPGDTVIMRLPLDSYDVSLSGVPIACRDRSGLTRRPFLGAAGATFVLRFNVFCNTFLAMNVATVSARDAVMDPEYVYRLLDPEGEILRAGVVQPVDTVLFDDVAPGAYTLELTHVDPACLVVSDGGPSRMFVIDPPRVALIRYQVECSNPAKRPRITHFESSYRDGFSAFYLEAVDVDPDGPAMPQVPDIDAYHWAITDCARNELHTTRPRRGLAQYGAVTRAADTVRIAAIVPLGRPDAEMLGRCTSIRVTDLDGNTSLFVEEPIGDEVGMPPVDVGSNAVLDASGTRLAFQVSAFDVDGDFAGSFHRFVLDDGTLGQPDGLPDIVSRNSHGYAAGTSVPAFPLLDPPYTLDKFVEVRFFLIDRQANFTEVRDRDFTR